MDDQNLVSILAQSYYLRSVHRDFAIGARSSLVYALPSGQVHFSKVNPAGPDPEDYIGFARADLVDASERSDLNAVGNANVAIHLAVDSMIRLLGFSVEARKAPFPKKLGLLASVGALPNHVLQSLNQKRNILEHDYRLLPREECVQFVDISELFVAFAYTFFSGTVTAAYVGCVEDEYCYEFVLDPESGTLGIAQVEAPSFLHFEFGVIHINIGESATRSPRTPAFVNAAGADAPQVIRNILVYCTRKRAMRLLRGPGGLISSRTSVTFPRPPS